MQMKPAQVWPLALIPVTVIADQVSKYWVLSNPRFHAMECFHDKSACGMIELPGPIDLSMVWNRGMSYGMFQSEGMGRWVLAAIMLAIALGFLRWLLVAKDGFLRLSLALVIGGAFGNLIDRVRFGAVVDFINAGALHFPWVFNVADAAISVGAVLLFFDQFVLSGRKQAKSHS
ncbi:MAG TPA: signal peptidase II [Hyphomonas sp.]|nr:signal peptidase II [Hyphomonas sp.]